jgi:hypothetical protein
VDEDYLMRGGVEPPDPILIREPPGPNPIEAANPGVGAAGLQFGRDPMDPSRVIWNDCGLSPKKKGCGGGGVDE